MSNGIQIIRYVDEDGNNLDPGMEEWKTTEFSVPSPVNFIPAGVPDRIFSEASIRLGFLRKVFGIYTAQLILTLSLIGITNFIDPVRTFLDDNVLLCAGISLGLSAIIFLFLLIKKEITKRFPLNFLFLTLFTLLFGFGVASITTLVEKEDVFYGGGILLCSTLTVTLYTLQSRFDLKWYGHLLIVVGSVGVVTTIMYFAIPPREDLVLVISAIGSLVISIYLAIFTQAIMSGKCMTLGPEYYVMVALSAYLVVIIVFLLALLVLAAATGGCKDCSNCNCEGSGGGGCYMPLYCMPCWYPAPAEQRHQSPEDGEEGN